MSEKVGLVGVGLVGAALAENLVNRGFDSLSLLNQGEGIA